MQCKSCFLSVTGAFSGLLHWHQMVKMNTDRLYLMNSKDEHLYCYQFKK